MRKSPSSSLVCNSTRTFTYFICILGFSNVRFCFVEIVIEHYFFPKNCIIIFSDDANYGQRFVLMSFRGLLDVLVHHNIQE